ncbi:hypothetical protein HRR83_008592 [Exophiala dermatitidis]|nr:hypothetical protein HRR74_008473 [Exophiala dermatitidis]KAJ4563624.1 hypothetical protein HRR81_008459 [Exophiala dermatitidis]KAJ4566117.1 hypothetical protein HRR82_008703 [Exophiala dermatitidis]KAJ4588300.1 hypothetical protein HRR83_008592 [Exophiala dermatitidis]KAJ4603522.1 hypothetical protein HRR85_008584 [Exophiala dermatitidis]
MNQPRCWIADLSSRVEIARSDERSPASREIEEWTLRSPAALRMWHHSIRVIISIPAGRLGSRHNIIKQDKSIGQDNMRKTRPETKPGTYNFLPLSTRRRALC